VLKNEKFMLCIKIYMIHFDCGRRLAELGEMQMSVSVSSSPSPGLFALVWPMPPTESRDYRLPPHAVWLCQAIRLGIVVLILWRFYLVARFPFHDDWLIHDMKEWTKIDITGFAEWQRYALLLLNLAVLSALQAMIYVSLFQLFTGFLRGEVFAVETGLRLRRAGLFTMSFVIAGPVRSFFAVAILTAHLPEGPHWIAPGFYLAPLYDFVLGGAGVALGEVFRAAAVIAKENAEIV